MPSAILMPALSPTMKSGKLARWLVAEGDEVNAGDPIAEIETDKATMEVEAVEEGRLGRILVAEGTADVAVNTPIGVILEEDEDESALENFDPAAPVPGAPEPKKPAVASKPEEAKEKPKPKSAKEGAERMDTKSPGGGDGKEQGGRIFASPVASRLAAEAGLNLADIEGSGPRGRIVKRDVEEAMEAGKAAKAAPEEKSAAREAEKPAVEAAELPEIAGYFEEGTYEAESVDMVRKVIARRLTDSKRDIPHYYLTVDCDIGRLVRLVEEINAVSPASDEPGKITLNDFIVKASALALMKQRGANASWGETAILRHSRADVAVAVATDYGLITPIVREAEKKPVAVISREVKDLAKRAREKKLVPMEYEGGTFTVSNLGMFGIKHFTAVINPPQGAILAIGAGEERPVVRNGALAIATVMTVTMSCDHRVIDGAVGARWLQAFKAFIEDPAKILT